MKKCLAAGCEIMLPRKVGSKGRQRKFCSALCRNRHGRGLAKREDAPSKSCKRFGCGREAALWRGRDRRRAFCSDECALIHEGKRAAASVPRTADPRERVTLEILDGLGRSDAGPRSRFPDYQFPDFPGPSMEMEAF